MVVPAKTEDLRLLKREVRLVEAVELEEDGIVFSRTTRAPR